MINILLVDSAYEKWAAYFNGDMEIIKAGSAPSSLAALKIIGEHPEADWILLGGRFVKGNCLNVAPDLSKETAAKIICFAADPNEWKGQLSRYGVRHFPGKKGDFMACVKGACRC